MLDIKLKSIFKFCGWLIVLIDNEEFSKQFTLYYFSLPEGSLKTLSTWSMIAPSKICPIISEFVLILLPLLLLLSNHIWNCIVLMKLPWTKLCLNVKSELIFLYFESMSNSFFGSFLWIFLVPFDSTFHPWMGHVPIQPECGNCKIDPYIRSNQTTLVKRDVKPMIRPLTADYNDTNVSFTSAKIVSLITNHNLF